MYAITKRSGQSSGATVLCYVPDQGDPTGEALAEAIKAGWVDHCGVSRSVERGGGKRRMFCEGVLS